MVVPFDRNRYETTGTPYAVLEGALIAATAIGADQAIIAVRREIATPSEILWSSGSGLPSPFASRIHIS